MEHENLNTEETANSDLGAVSGSTGLKVRGFIHEHPKFDK